jgi:trimeric autotransporter adhesin
MESFDTKGERSMNFVNVDLYKDWITKVVWGVKSNFTKVSADVMKKAQNSNLKSTTESIRKEINSESINSTKKASQTTKASIYVKTNSDKLATASDDSIAKENSTTPPTKATFSNSTTSQIIKTLNVMKNPLKSMENATIVLPETQSKKSTENVNLTSTANPMSASNLSGNVSSTKASSTAQPSTVIKSSSSDELSTTDSISKANLVSTVNTLSANTEATATKSQLNLSLSAVSRSAKALNLSSSMNTTNEMRVNSSDAINMSLIDISANGTDSEESEKSLLGQFNLPPWMIIGATFLGSFLILLFIFCILGQGKPSEHH